FLITLLVDVFYSGMSRISYDFVTGSLSRHAHMSGILPAIVGTFVIMLLTAVIAIPIGVGAGAYLEEYGKNNGFAAFLEIYIANLAGVPFIIYGILGLQLFSRWMNLGGSFLAGALTLSLLTLPIFIVASRCGLKTVHLT